LTFGWQGGKNGVNELGGGRLTMLMRWLKRRRALREEKRLVEEAMAIGTRMFFFSKEEWPSFGQLEEGQISEGAKLLLEKFLFHLRKVKEKTLVHSKDVCHELLSGEFYLGEKLLIVDFQVPLKDLKFCGRKVRISRFLIEPPDYGE